MESLLLFAVGLIAGVAIGAWAAWHRWLKAERPVVHADLVIDPAVLSQIDATTVMLWLDRKGLTWTAKGAVYDPAKTVKK